MRWSAYITFLTLLIGAEQNEQHPFRLTPDGKLDKGGCRGRRILRLGQS